ncbi:MAG TPA: ABC transporter permease [Streptosporangiaceae bacterium]|jgi:ABC-type multidrug transport system permease subunit
MLSATLAMVRKDLLATRRHPLFLVISVLVPVAFVFLYALIVQAATTIPLAVAQESHGPYSDRFVQTLQTMRSEDGKAWELHRMSPDKAAAAYRSGDVVGMLRIPASFDRDAAAGRAQVQLSVLNINSDISKNYQLRVEHAINAMHTQADPAHSVQIQEHPRWARDMSFSRYMGAGLLMFAIIYAAMVNTGNLVAREWEERTAKNVVLSPRGLMPLILGKWLTMFVQTVVSVALVVIALKFALHYPISRLGPATWGPIAMLVLYGAAFGVLLGTALRRSLVLVPVAAVLTLLHFLLVGFESYMRGYAHGGLVEVLWQSTRWWPVAAVTDQIRFAVEGLRPVQTIPQYMLWMAVLVVVLTAAAVRVLRTRLRFTQGQ